jgi:hypothetical protein
MASLYKLATKEISINSAKAFIDSLNASDGRNSKKSVILYAVLGKGSPWDDEPNPPAPIDTVQKSHYDVHRNAIAAKKVTSDNVSFVAPRHDWVSGTVYSMYRDTDSDMFNKSFYVFTDEYSVYKCLYNNGGAQSIVKPTGYSTIPFTTSDGYTWRYMYSVSLGEARKFLTSSYIPVKTLEAAGSSVEGSRQFASQSAASNGSIDILEINTPGYGYVQVPEGVVELATTNTLKLSSTGAVPPSPVDNFYNGCSVYIYTGAGAGQLRRIINYTGSTKTLTVNTAFATVANTDSRVIISPTVTIIGDGSGAKAYARVSSSGAVSNISVIDTGQLYTRAKAYISSNSIHGTGATANVVISPVGGHGIDPIRELYADKLMLNVSTTGNEGVSSNGNGYIPSNTSFRTVSILKDPILKVNANNEVKPEHIANSSNSPSTLNLMTRMQISYLQMDSSNPVNELQNNDLLTNERNRAKAEFGQLEFTTDTSYIKLKNDSLKNAMQAANAAIVYIRDDETETDPSFYTVYLNNVQSYSNYPAFTKDDVLLTSESDVKVATVERIRGPEANTFSGEILYTENVEPVTRNVNQIEDFKIILDF